MDKYYIISFKGFGEHIGSSVTFWVIGNRVGGAVRAARHRLCANGRRNTACYKLSNICISPIPAAAQAGSAV